MIHIQINEVQSNKISVVVDCCACYDMLLLWVSHHFIVHLTHNSRMETQIIYSITSYTSHNKHILPATTHHILYYISSLLLQSLISYHHTKKRQWSHPDWDSSFFRYHHITNNQIPHITHIIYLTHFLLLLYNSQLQHTFLMDITHEIYLLFVVITVLVMWCTVICLSFIHSWFCKVIDNNFSVDARLHISPLSLYFKRYLLMFILLFFYHPHCTIHLHHVVLFS